MSQTVDMGHDVAEKFSRYFCIFCSESETFETIQEAYEHYKRHMNSGLYCITCDGKQGGIEGDACQTDHKEDSSEFNVESELSVIEMWIERFLSYQEELIGKHNYNIMTQTKFFLGCPVCDKIIKFCNVVVPDDVTQKAFSSNLSLSSPSSSELSTSNSNSTKEAVKCHTIRHVNAHCRYYPYECQNCEKLGRYQKKPDLSEMMRHVKDGHSKDIDNPEDSVKYVKISKLESFIEVYLRNRHMIRFDPVLPPKPEISAINQVLMEQRNYLKAQLSAGPFFQHSPVNPSIKQPNDSSSSFHSRQNYKSPVSSLSILSPNQSRIFQHFQSNSEMSFELMDDSNSIKSDSFSHASKPQSQSNFIKSRSSDCRSTFSNSDDSNQSNFHRQFGNIFEEDMAKFSLNHEEDLDAEYFCVFCPDSDKFKAKDEARRHYQKHLSYYPMQCSLCGEGSTDMQEFLKHHTEVHPEAEKGRYKRREQPIIEKWISGFLYAQATIIRAFPPREHCPVCEKVFTVEHIKSTRPRRCTVNRKIDHVHRHLCYLPYECIKCKNEGKEFLVAYFESKAHSHIKLKHPEIDETDSRWLVFQKSISIPKLDEFVANFFTKFGISMEFERRPIKKQNFSSPLLDQRFLFSSDLGSMNALQLHPSIAISGAANTMGSQRQYMTSPTLSNSDGVLVIDEEDRTMQSEFGVEDGDEENLNAIIVEVSPSHANFLDIPDDFNSNELKYFCIFCPAHFSSKIQAYPHYGEHLDYRPVVCLLCDNRYYDIESFTIHHQINHMERTDLLYEIREDQKIEKWVDDFLESFEQGSAQQLLLPCSCSTCCPVCDKIRPTISTITPCVHHNDVDFSDHIHSHLAYYSYECSFCKNLGLLCKVPNLDAIALNHLKEYHNLDGASMLTLYKTFPKTLSISKLEKFIAESIHRRRSFERKCRFVRVDQQLNNNVQANNGLPKAHRPFETFNNKNPSGYVLSRGKMNLNVLPTKPVTHVRVEGGRVVNLPSSLSLRAVQRQKLVQKQKSVNDLRVPENPQELVPNSVSNFSREVP